MNTLISRTFDTLQALLVASILGTILLGASAVFALFGTGIGHYLQYLESRFMVNVFLYCAVMGATALPIHDCLIVRKSHKGRAIGIMQLMAKRVLGRELPCEGKRGR